jgi:hypothetical protein
MVTAIIIRDFPQIVNNYFLFFPFFCRKGAYARQCAKEAGGAAAKSHAA